jgi:asparagine synthetase B (glutamine-hydrolysing)
MHRINYRRDYGSTSPFPYSVENITKYWPFHEFEQRLARLQANKEAMQGTFVAALWDTRQRRLILTNDRFGMKPLYYAQTPGRLLLRSMVTTS